MDEKPDSPNPNDRPQPAAPAPEAAAAPEPKWISIGKFSNIELRVARIVAAERIENADKLLKLRVDLGNEERQLVAGIAEAYETDSLIGRRIVVVANLKPARIRGVESQGMLLAADLDGRPILAGFDEDVAPGTRVR